MNETLKELLKPPFKQGNIEDGYIYDSNDRESGRIVRVMGIIGDEFTVEEKASLQDWITSALNEKYERDFSEPKRWIQDTVWIMCPFCSANYKVGQGYHNYCGNCGQQLEPSEEE